MYCANIYHKIFVVLKNILCLHSDEELFFRKGEKSSVLVFEKNRLVANPLSATGHFYVYQEILAARAVAGVCVM
jgi:hypothetical protein